MKFRFRLLKKFKTIIKPVLKKANPVTPGQRHYKYILKTSLAKSNKLIKLSKFNIFRCYGKSSITGHTTVWGRFSGCKKLYRKLNFFNKDILGIILFSIYDPNRTCFISAFFNFLDFKFSFIPAIQAVNVGAIVGCKEPNFRYYKGFRYQLLHHLNGSILSFLNTNKHTYAKYAKSAGVFCQLIYKSKVKLICKIRLPSNQIISLSPFCFATLGAVSNLYHRFIVLGKAGRRRLKGFKSKVRGIAMNPVDHPHGGRSNGGCCWVTPWGKPFRYKKTSNSKIKKIYKLL